MPVKYTVVRILTSEEARYKGKPLPAAISDFIGGLNIAARCMAVKGFAGCYENGEVVAAGIEALSCNLPVEITVVFPAAEREKVLPVLDEMVQDGLLFAEEREMRLHRCRRRLLPRALRVRDAMTVSPVTAGVDDSAGRILALLWRAPFHAVPVVDRDGRPAGIVTHGDLVRRAEVPLRPGLFDRLGAHQLAPLEESLAKLPARAVMSAPAITVPEDAPLSEAVNLMLRHNLKRLPVTGGGGALRGIVSRLDVFKTILDKNPPTPEHAGAKLVLSEGGTAAQAMRLDTPVLPPEAPLDDALGLIETTDIKRIAVTDGRGRLLGLISDRALLGVLAGPGEGVWDYLAIHLPFLAQARRRAVPPCKASTAGDIMNTELFTVDETVPLAEAVRLMVDKKLKRLPVVDAAGVFKGMLTRDSILRAELRA